MLGVSERFACRVTGQHRATQRHEPAADTPDDPDAALRAWLRTYAKNHPRRGFRPAYHDARGEEDWIVNHKKIQRLWREEGLRVPQRRRRKRHGNSTATDVPTADAPNRVWAVDFQLLNRASRYEEAEELAVAALHSRASRNITRIGQLSCFPGLLSTFRGSDTAGSTVKHEYIGTHCATTNSADYSDYVK